MFSQAQLLQQQQQAQQKQEMLMAACMLLQQQPSSQISSLNSAWMQARALTAGASVPPSLTGVSSASSSSSKNSSSAGDTTTADEATEVSSVSKVSEASDQLSDDDFFSQENSIAEGAHTDRDTKNETFPIKLYRMLHEAEKASQDTIVSFSPSGRAFHIHKPEEFIRDVMPKYFTTTRLASFQRQLNLYGFRRLTHGVDKGGYTHSQQYFVKGKRHLCNRIKRKTQGLVHKPVSAGGYGSMYGNAAAAAMMMNPSSMMVGASAAASGSPFGMFGAAGDGAADIHSLLGGGGSTSSALSALAATANYNARLNLLAAQQQQSASSRPQLSSLMGLVRQGLFDGSSVGNALLHATTEKNSHSSMDAASAYASK